ncbi:MAG: DUF1629 domain-containing protein [Phycisphaerae bacterium]
MERSLEQGHPNSADAAELFLYRPDANRFAGIGIDGEFDDVIGRIHKSDVPLLPTWRPIPFHWFSDNQPTRGDFPSLSNYWVVPVMSESAETILNSRLHGRYEALPIYGGSTDRLSILHVMETVDCLDLEKSEVERYSDGGVMRVLRYAVRREEVEGRHVFKLPQEHGRALIIDQVFKDWITDAGLTGLTFRKLAVQWL